ncbi:MAG: transposase [Candidatus Muirbacterium halophilum]|nr:transposase [Candidatus Muirbacterium halophilum]MCK9477283.1 transposase [Candidatus Muirbacterium halophilum]
MQETNVRYSEAFKQKVIKEISKGKFRSLLEAKDRYGIGGSVTINSWIKKYGKQDLLPRKVRIEMPEEKDEIKKLKHEIKKLKFALSNAKV